MTRTPLLLALAATAALAGCDNTIVAGGPQDDPANQAPVTNEPVVLPPAIVGSHVYRCRDNSLVYIDWLNNDTARIKTSREDVGVTVTKGGGGAYGAEGQKLTGEPSGTSITVNGKSCKR